MACRGCPGTQQQVGDEQFGLSLDYQPDERTLLVQRRVNLCMACGSWEGFWTCSELMGNAVELRRRLKCPDCRCPLLKW